MEELNIMKIQMNKMINKLIVPKHEQLVDKIVVSEFKKITNYYEGDKILYKILLNVYLKIEKNDDPYHHEIHDECKNMVDEIGEVINYIIIDDYRIIAEFRQKENGLRFFKHSFIKDRDDRVRLGY